MPSAESSDPQGHEAILEARAAVLAGDEPLTAVMERALWRAFGGGLAGAAGMIAALGLLTPLRTITAVQMNSGGSVRTSFMNLLREGGVRRLYRGMGMTMVQVPLGRFGDTACNAGAMAALSSLEATRDWPVAAQTAVSATAAALFRTVLTPLDALKVAAQTGGATGWPRLREAVRTRGVGALWDGGKATGVNALVGHYAYFGTFNTLLANVPAAGGGPVERAAHDVLGLSPGTAALVERTLRNASIGLTSGIVADAAANSIRVVKTMKMTTGRPYSACVIAVIQADGLHGLFFRGFVARMSANGLAGLINGVTWRYLDSTWVAHEGDGVHRSGIAQSPPLPPPPPPPPPPPSPPATSRTRTGVPQAALAQAQAPTTWQVLWQYFQPGSAGGGSSERKPV